eukprot:CAMPEP_0116560994 /NCGR_PEP_ID=MMETSP0397-20121206/11316_1 /TAXON_ID=216820 /ORGANISM="Cyclophora tenuis, Strain ECT3854" /LENGTH=139 /DNA_ID=CAMNT_0004087047 /DNA_START=27 /DNA_END=446 /DNA_ORIENTATION=+
MTVSREAGDDNVTVSVQVTPREYLVEETEVEQDQNKRQVRGAGIGAGLVGLMIGGPVVGVAAGIGAAVAATTDGDVGDLARASGTTVANVGARIREWDSNNARVVQRLGDWNEKHHVIETAARPVVRGYNYLRNGEVQS